MVEYYVGGAYAAADVVAGGGAGGAAGIAVGEQARGQGGEVVAAGDLKGAAGGDEVGGFLEFMVPGAEYDRDAVYGGFVDIVYAGAESTAYKGHVGQAVERAEQAE